MNTVAQASKSSSELFVQSFPSSDKWRKWLSKNYERQEGVWLRFFKKDSMIKSLTRAEALDEALCYGWIDGQAKPYDDKSWLVKFIPRRPKSIWSKRNRENVERLIDEKRMRPSGLREIENARADGRWDAAYDSPRTMEMPEDFLEELKKDKNAYEFFKTLNKSNTYGIAWRLQTAARPETRERRKKKLLEMLKRREKLH